MKIFISVITFMLLISSFSLVDARRGSDDSDSSSSTSSSSSSSSDDSDDDSDDSDDDNSSDDSDDDMVNGVKLRGDGTVDDNSSDDSDDDMVNGVKLRGDGTVDDNSSDDSDDDSNDDSNREHRERVLGARHVTNFDNKVNTLIDVLLARGTSEEQDIQLLEDAMDKVVGKIDNLMLKAKSVVLKNKLSVLREMTVEKFDEAIVDVQGEIDSILDSIMN